MAAPGHAGQVQVRPLKPTDEQLARATCIAFYFHYSKKRINFAVKTGACMTLPKH